MRCLHLHDALLAYATACPATSRDLCIFYIALILIELGEPFTCKLLSFLFQELDSYVVWVEPLSACFFIVIRAYGWLILILETLTLRGLLTLFSLLLIGSLRLLIGVLCSLPLIVSCIWGRCRLFDPVLVWAEVAATLVVAIFTLRVFLVYWRCGRLLHGG